MSNERVWKYEMVDGESDGHQGMCMSHVTRILAKLMFLNLPFFHFCPIYLSIPVNKSLKRQM
jgi:hypothetical protein